MGEVCAVYGGAVGIERHIAPYRAPKPCSIYRKYVFFSSVLSGAYIHRQLSAVGWQLAFGCDIYVECLCAFDLLPLGVYHVLFGDIAVEVCGSLSLCRGDKRGREYLAHLVSIDVLLLTPFQCKRCRGQGCTYKHHEHYYIDHGIGVALFIHNI